jgi:tol-pal system protein YbgF
MIKQVLRTALCLGMIGMSGCATAGSSQMESTVYDTHRRVVKLDNSLESTVTKLNETTAELVARVNQSDQETRRLKSVVEENRVILERLEKNLGDLTSVIYRQFNLTPPGSSSSGIVIEPPARTSESSMQPLDEPKEEDVDTETVAVNTPAQPMGDPTVQYQRAQQLYANEDFSAALGGFDEYLQKFSGSDPVNTANAQFWKAKCYLKLGQYNDAIREFEKVRSSYPTSTKVPFAMHNQAVAHSNLGQASEAISLMEEVVADYPISPAAEQAKIDLNKLRGN